ncbi:MAG: hypothetical protein GTN80_03225 [Nitrososphaeria archaeon]|nr:hypothetical protein [Nitrososphaeria archaeon]NIN52192.1 hypothetical protein [Nitrososphaeria archaeon]NIQ32645.1 hypothetical protein [Nitrososphaeria archaeon]
MKDSERKGVSEVVSSLLVLIIAISIGIGLFSFGMSVFGSNQSSFVSRTELRKEILLERFVDAGGYYNASDNALEFVILNYGMKEVTIASIYVNNEVIDEPLEKPRFLPDGDPLIKVHGMKWVRVEVPPDASEPFTVVVVSERGNSVEFDLEQTYED